MTIPATGMALGTVFIIAMFCIFGDQIIRFNAKTQSNTFFLSPALLMQAVMCLVHLFTMALAIFFRIVRWMFDKIS